MTHAPTGRDIGFLVLCSILRGGIGDAQAPRTLAGQVVNVVDGDTIHVRLGTQIEKVRYIGVTAPELHHATKGVEPLAREATEANRKRSLIATHDLG